MRIISPYHVSYMSHSFRLFSNVSHWSSSCGHLVSCLFGSVSNVSRLQSHHAGLPQVLDFAPFVGDEVSSPDAGRGLFGPLRPRRRPRRLRRRRRRAGESSAFHFARVVRRRRHWRTRRPRGSVCVWGRKCIEAVVSRNVYNLRK